MTTITIRRCADLGCAEPHGSACHCSRCHRDFAGLTAFDAHLVNAGTAGCQDPAGRGLVLKDRAGGRQVWGHPADERAAERFRVLNAARQDAAAGHAEPERMHHGQHFLNDHPVSACSLSRCGSQGTPG